jgi:peptidoglycan lytic transglycosylase
MQAIGPMAWRVLPPSAAGLLLGAALLTGAAAPAWAQQALPQTALGAPRSAADGAAAAAAAGLPPVLASSDAARLRRIFDLQARGDLAAAAQEATRLDDRRLMGHVLADRWLRPGAAPPPSAAEVQAWLAEHADHPDARRLHELLGRLLPRGAALPAPPQDPGGLSPEAVLVPEERDAAAPVARNPALDRAVRDRAREGDAPGALALVARTRGVAPAYAAVLRGEAALALFQAGRDEEAFRLASEAARSAAPGGGAGAAFTAGLAAWGLGRHETALPYFERAARTEGAAPALRSAAAFWTARAGVRARQPALYVPWMTLAAQEPRTFYGLVARRALGLPANFAWDRRDVLGEAEAAMVAETAGGWRALALLQVGQPARAEAELRGLWSRARDNPGLARAMLAVAGGANLAALSSQLAAVAQGRDGRPRDFARFPVPPLRPEGGFRVDPALVYAVALQESRFDANAVSPAGARGLMQLMPATASYVARDPSLQGEAVGRLHEPGLSLELGQRYLHYLARHEAVGGDLIRLLAAYNAGPGNLSRWLPATRHRDDPFLFVEAIPVDETRDYVRRVLAFSWIYASRLRLPTPSLDRLAAGGFPAFAGPEEVTVLLRTARPGALQ